jgi:hypothetical protein
MRLGELNTIDFDGTFTLPASDTSELTLLEVIVDDVVNVVVNVGHINLDVSTLLVGATFRIYYKIDGVNYRLRFGTGGTISWTPGTGEWVQFVIGGLIDHDLKLTIQSDGEVADRDILYTYNGAR